jgi:hypothetical protein
MAQSRQSAENRVIVAWPRSSEGQYENVPTVGRSSGSASRMKERTGEVSLQLLFSRDSW